MLETNGEEVCLCAVLTGISLKINMLYIMLWQCEIKAYSRLGA